MTVRKAIRKAMENSSLRGIETDTYYMGEQMNRTHLSYREESLAREIANATITASMYMGIYMSVDDIAMQEKWERILLQLQPYDVVEKGERYNYNLIP